MRAIATLIVAVVCQVRAVGAEPEKFFYVGEAKPSSGDGQPMDSQVILLEKIHDRDKSTITERAITVTLEGKAEEHTVVLTVQGDNSFTLADAADTVEGTGALFGPAWKWTYFKGTFRHKSGVVIEDENYMPDDSVITARKKVSGEDGKVITIMDMSLKAVTPKTFEILAAGLLKKRATARPARPAAARQSAGG